METGRESPCRSAVNMYHGRGANGKMMSSDLSLLDGNHTGLLIHILSQTPGLVVRDPAMERTEYLNHQPLPKLITLDVPGFLKTF